MSNKSISEHIETDKKTYKGYFIQGTHCVLKPTQHETMSATFDQFVDQCTAVGLESKLTLDSHILLTVNNVTGRKVKTWQVGADRTNNMTPVMVDLSKAINKMVVDSADCVINGKAMFMCTDGTPREYSGTFTTRTPNGANRKEYIEELTAQVKDATEELTK